MRRRHLESVEINDGEKKTDWGVWFTTFMWIDKKYCCFFRVLYNEYSLRLYIHRIVVIKYCCTKKRYLWLSALFKRDVERMETSIKQKERRKKPLRRPSFMNIIILHKNVFLLLDAKIYFFEWEEKMSTVKPWDVRMS